MGGTRQFLQVDMRWDGMAQKFLRCFYSRVCSKLETSIALQEWCKSMQRMLSRKKLIIFFLVGNLEWETYVIVLYCPLLRSHKTTGWDIRLPPVSGSWVSSMQSNSTLSSRQISLRHYWNAGSIILSAPCWNDYICTYYEPTHQRVCRYSLDHCDTPEYCQGYQTDTCPADAIRRCPRPTTVSHCVAPSFTYGFVESTSKTATTSQILTTTSTPPPPEDDPSPPIIIIILVIVSVVSSISNSSDEKD